MRVKRRVKKLAKLARKFRKSPNLVQLVLLFGVLPSLCLSKAEHNGWLPFPILSVNDDQAARLQRQFGDHFSSHFGFQNKPQTAAEQQKNSFQQFLELALPADDRSLVQTTCSALSLRDCQASILPSNYCVLSASAGRAPPFIQSVL